MPINSCVMLDISERGESVADRVSKQFMQTLSTMTELGQMLETNEYPEGMVLPAMIEIDDLLANLMNDMNDDREIQRFVKWEEESYKPKVYVDARTPLDKLTSRIEKLESIVQGILNREGQHENDG